jgi:hypothetical protein
MISEGTEDGRISCVESLYSFTDLASALKLETLLKLSESTTFDLRAAYGFTIIERESIIS